MTWMTRQALGAALALGLSAAAACSPTKAPAADATQAPTTSPAADSADKASSPREAQATFTALTQDQMTPAQRAQLERAIKAQQDLGGTMMGLVAATMQRDGAPAAIELCAQEAPKLAQRLGEQHQVRLGRTSHKQRNPKNSPPPWAVPLVQAGVEQPQVLAHPDGTLAVLSPIRLMPSCVTCHGQPEQLAPGVAQAIQARYPQDQATGFKPNDLRGWFWVEVPPQAQTF